MLLLLLNYVVLWALIMEDGCTFNKHSL